MEWCSASPEADENWDDSSSSSCSSIHHRSFISAGGVTLEAIMAQLVHMDAHLDTLSDELCQVNTPVSRIARWQAVMGGFTVASFPSPEASEDDDDDFDDDDADEDDGASSSSDDEMSTWYTYLLSLVTKRGVVLRWE